VSLKVDLLHFSEISHQNAIPENAAACSRNSITHIKYGIQNYVFEEVEE
jgi:hypothetical protein